MSADVCTDIITASLHGHVKRLGNLYVYARVALLKQETELEGQAFEWWGRRASFQSSACLLRKLPSNLFSAFVLIFRCLACMKILPVATQECPCHVKWAH